MRSLWEKFCKILIIWAKGRKAASEANVNVGRCNKIGAHYCINRKERAYEWAPSKEIRVVSCWEQVIWTHISKKKINRMKEQQYAKGKLFSVHFRRGSSSTELESCWARTQPSWLLSNKTTQEQVKRCFIDETIAVQKAPEVCKGFSDQLKTGVSFVERSKQG